MHPAGSTRNRATASLPPRGSRRTPPLRRTLVGHAERSAVEEHVGVAIGQQGTEAQVRRFCTIGTTSVLRLRRTRGPDPALRPFHYTLINSTHSGPDLAWR